MSPAGLVITCCCSLRGTSKTTNDASNAKEVNADNVKNDKNGSLEKCGVRNRNEEGMTRYGYDIYDIYMIYMIYMIYIYISYIYDIYDIFNIYDIYIYI